MTDTKELKVLFQNVLESTDAFPVDFDQAWNWIGYARKDSALRSLIDNFIEGTDYNLLHTKVEQVSGAKHVHEYRLTVDCFKSFCMLAGTEKGKEEFTYGKSN